MAGTVVADTLQAASTSTLVLKNGVANTPPTVQDSAGTQIGTFCRAWVNFNGTGTVAIRASFNVSSITDNGTGNYTVNFTTAMSDANYVAHVTGATGDTNSVAIGGRYTTSTASACQVSNAQSGVGGVDVSFVSVSIFR
jgi:hypothetical protein